MVITEKAIDDTPQRMLITMLCTVLQIIGSVILPGASLLARSVFDAAPMSWVEKVVASKKKTKSWRFNKREMEVVSNHVFFGNFPNWRDSHVQLRGLGIWPNHRGENGMFLPLTGLRIDRRFTLDSHRGCEDCIGVQKPSNTRPC